MAHVYNVYEINLWLFNIGKDFRTVKLIKNADFVKRKYSGYGVGVDARGNFSLSDGSGLGKNVIICGADISSSVHIDNKKKYILILSKGPTNGFDDSKLTAEKEGINNR